MPPRNSGLIAIVLIILAASPAPAGDHKKQGIDSSEWTLVNGNANWAPRSGLQVVQLRNRFYLMGGRTPVESTVPGDSFIWGDVWRSDDRGVSWKQILDTDAEGHWPARAFFQAATKGGYMYVFGGQNFLLVPNECPSARPLSPAPTSSTTYGAAGTVFTG